MSSPSSVVERLSVVSLFSGAGGLDLGLAAADMDVVYASDIDGPSCETLEHNKSHAVAHGLDGLRSTLVEQRDVASLRGDEILAKIDKKVGEVDILAGGPPCQAFSVFGRRAGIADKRGKLVFEYARLLNEIRPRVFVFENVYGLLTVQNGEVFAEVCSSLSEPGKVSYKVAWTRLNAQDFGVPQSRDRVIVVGVRDDGRTSAINFDPSPVAAPDCGDRDVRLRWRTVSDAFSGLPAPNTKRGESIPNHHTRRHGSDVIDRYKKLSHGERDSKTRINRLDPSRPSFTIVVGSDAGGGKGHVHPRQPREVSPRESARIQSFPDWWEFRGSSVRHEIRQVGNAVPPLLAFALGNELRTSMFGLDKIPYSSGVDRLGQNHLFAPSELDSLDAVG